jgi:hypothetical protein
MKPKKVINQSIIVIFLVTGFLSCKNKETKKVENTSTTNTMHTKGTFGFDKAFLKEHYSKTIVLESVQDKASIILSPELQGRVMTSSLNGDEGKSFGWINHDLIASGELSEQFNAFGGEERFWLGPEGGQFSLYFPEKVSFDFKNWKVPALIDSEVFQVISNNTTSAVFNKKSSLKNYSGTTFDMDITRTVNLLSKETIKNNLGLPSTNFSAVAYETINEVKNIGDETWTEQSGTISVWMLCMFNPSPEVTVVAPVNEGSEVELGKHVNDDYFGVISEDRLKVIENTVYFKADGKSRGKIGFSPKRSTKYIGSYDAENKVLSVLEIDAPKPTDKYVNSAWEIQDDPFSGDVINSYNDGPLEDGGQLGPFYELESSSPALFLSPTESYAHTQKMYHFSGEEAILDAIAKQVLKVSLQEIKSVFK